MNRYTQEDKKRLLAQIEADIQSGIGKNKAVTKNGIAVGTYYEWTRRMKVKEKKQIATVRVTKVMPEADEDVKIVVMKGPGSVIEKIAAALGGVL